MQVVRGGEKPRGGVWGPVSHGRKVCGEEGQAGESNTAERSGERRRRTRPSGFTTQRAPVSMTSTTSLGRTA